MRFVLALLLLIFRLEPLAGAAMCALERAAPAEECGEMEEMRQTAPAKAPRPTSGESAIVHAVAAAAACPLASACAPGTVVTLAQAASLGSVPHDQRGPDQPHAAVLRAGDPVAPPIPPPIA